jgi:flagellar biosynthesis GTPase FlhF
MKMPESLSDFIKKLREPETPEYILLENVLTILKKKLNAKTTESYDMDNIMLPLYLQKLNPLLLSNSIYKDPVALQLLKINTAKEIKKIIDKHQDFFQSDELQEFAKSILQQTATITPFQRELHKHLERKFLSGILSGYVSVEKEGVIINEEDGKTNLVGTGDIVITITDPQTKEIIQFVIECDGESHAEKDDSKRNALLEKFCEDRFLIIPHRLCGFGEHLKSESAELLNDFIKRIRNSECFQEAVKTRNHSSSLQPTERARSSNQFTSLETKPSEEEETKPSEKEETKPSKKETKAKRKKIASEGDNAAIEEAIKKNKQIEQKLQELLEQIKVPETKQKAIDDLIKQYQQKDFSGFFKNKFKDILANDPKLALDILCDVSKDKTLQNDLFELAKDDIKKMLHHGIYHHLFDQEEFIKKIYPTLNSSKGEIIDILDCISQNLNFTNFIDKLNKLIPEQDRYIPERSKLIYNAILEHGNNIKNLINRHYKKEIPLIELFSYLCIAFSSGNIEASNILQKYLPEEAKGKRSEPIDVYPLLLYAILTKNWDFCELLLKKNKEHANLSNESEHSVLYFACVINSEKAVELLLKYGADPSLSTQNKQTTPLIIAIWQKNLEIVRLLLNKDPASHVNLQDKDGLTSLMLAVNKILALQKKQQSDTEKESEAKILEIIKLLLEKGAHVTLETQLTEDSFSQEVIELKSPLELIELLKEQLEDPRLEILYGKLLKCDIPSQSINPTSLEVATKQRSQQFS